MNRNTRKTRPGRRGLSIAAAMAFLVCSSLFLLLRDDDSTSASHSISAYGQAPALLQLRSSSFPAGGAMPLRLTCNGAGDSPELHWPTPPAGTRIFAVVMSEPDAPAGFTHWLAFNIPAGTRQLAEGASTHGAMPAGSAEGTNSFGRIGYGGPCPPPGKPHHYIFRIYALNAPLDLATGASGARIESAMSGHILAQGQIIGIYGRPGS